MNFGGSIRTFLDHFVWLLSFVCAFCLDSKGNDRCSFFVGVAALNRPLTVLESRYVEFVRDPSNILNKNLFYVELTTAVRRTTSLWFKNRQDVEDCAQITLIELAGNIGRNPYFYGVSHFEHLVWKVSCHHAINFERNASAKKRGGGVNPMTSSFDEVEAKAFDSLDPSSSSKILRQDLNSVLESETFSDRERAIIREIYFLRRTRKEAAKILRVSRATISRDLSAIREKLKKSLRDYQPTTLH